MNVTFSDSVKVHHMVAWSFAYKNARKMYWELFALDNMRFQRRIQQVSYILNPILQNEHRCKMYKRLFEREINV
jgi:Phosphatase-1 catalytic subunit binding region